MSTLPDIVVEKPELVPAVKDGDVWERLKGETQAAYANFCVYRDQTRGRHSLLRAADDRGKSVETMKDQSVKYRWQERVDAYEDYLERRDREIRESERDAINRQGVQLGRGFMAMSAARTAGGTYRGRQVRAMDPNQMSPADVARSAEIGWKMARLGTGQSTDAIRGLVAVTTEDHVEIVSDLYQMTLFVLPENLHQRFATVFNNYLETRARPWLS
jgi:hypothetical protein